MDIEKIKEQIKKDMLERKSPAYYKWTDEDGTEHDVFNYTSAQYFLDSMFVHIIRAGKKESEKAESDLRNAYNCGICYLYKIWEGNIPDEFYESMPYNECYRNSYEIVCEMSLQNIIDRARETVKDECAKSYNISYQRVIQFLIWYNINKESE